MSNYSCHMWGCRKADAVFPFVKSSFWKANGILIVSVKWVKRGEGSRHSHLVLHANAARPDHNCENMLICTNRGHGIHPCKYSQCNNTHTNSWRVSEAEQFLCQSSADTDGQYGGEEACQEEKSLNEMTDSLAIPLNLSALISHCPWTSTITNSSLWSYDKLDTCQSKRRMASSTTQVQHFTVF